MQFSLPVMLTSARLSLIGSETDHFSESGFLTLCLHAGYLTRRLSTSVCIPNKKVYQVWLQLFGRAVLGGEMADSSVNHICGSLIKELWEGKTNLLCALATSSHGVLTNYNHYKEGYYGNHVANTLVAVSRFGMLFHPSQKIASLSHVVPIRESHSGEGRCDYAMRLASINNAANEFGVVLGFKLIPSEKRLDKQFHIEKAKEGLDQISIKNYESSLTGCLEWLDAGMAIGNSAVYATAQLFRRNHPDHSWTPVNSLHQEIPSTPCMFAIK